MTVDEQLRQLARSADEGQRPITVDEVLARAAGRDGTRFLEPSRPTPVWRQGRPWLLVAAALLIVGVVGLGLLAMGTDDDTDSLRTVTVPPTTPADGVHRGLLVFAADAGAGAALTDPVGFQRVETVPEPMDLYVTRAGAPTRRLISSGAHERCPAFSPDGGRLAYLAVPATPVDPQDEAAPALDATLVVLRLDRSGDPGDPELEVRFPAPYGHRVQRNVGYPCPQWSPDGRSLAYLAQTADAPSGATGDAELRVVTLDGQEQVVDAGAPADERSPVAWSPAGDALAYARLDGVWVAPLDGGAPSLVWQPDGRPAALSWSAQGELAVTVEAPDAGREVHVLDVDAGTSTPVGTLGAGSAGWSPDGARLAFVRADGQIVLHDRDDGSTVLVPPPVVDGREIGFADVAWAPDGERLLSLVWAVSLRATEQDPGAFLESPGMALVSLSTDGAVDVLTPWTWAFDWIDLRDVTWSATG